MKWYLFLIIFVVNSWAVSFEPHSYCSGIKHCLGLEATECKDFHYAKNEDIEYNVGFCSEFEKAKKVLPDHQSHKAMKVYSLLGREYRMVYPIKGHLPISSGMMEYLMNNIPFAAQLINAYHDESYSASYLTRNKSVFKGTNGRSLRGRFVWAFQSAKRTSNLAYGDGYAKVLMWNLKGEALIYIRYFPVGNNEIDFEVDCVAFPGGSMLNGIMSMGVFKNMVIKKINHILDDVKFAASEYANGNEAPVLKLKSLQNPTGKKRLKEWNQILINEGYRKGAPIPKPQALKASDLNSLEKETK